MAYRCGSNWNDEAEMCCLLIMKVLEPDFRRGGQIKMCRKLYIDLEAKSLSAKVSNFKFVAGYIKSSNPSEDTKRIYDKFKSYTVDELKNVILQETKREEVKRWIQKMDTMLQLIYS